MSALWHRFCGSGRFVFCLLILFVAASMPGAEPEPGNPIRISFSGETLHASGITRGGDAIVFACTIGRFSGMRTLGRRAEVATDADNDGAIAVPVTGGAVASLWIVVDFTGGRYAVATPSGFALRTMDLPDHGWRGGREHFELGRRHVEVLVVRPGHGAWTLSAVEGGPDDSDGRLDSMLRFQLERMQRLHGGEAAPRPPVIVPRDLLVLIDPRELDFFISEAR